MMRIVFLGTAAANAYPEAFCKCDHCQEARELGGPSLRKRSAALINDDLLLDLGPDIMAAAQMHTISLTNVHYCLQTHPHADHMDLSHLLSRSPGFGVIGAPKLHFYASAATLQRADQTFRRDLAEYGLFDAEAEAKLNLKIHAVEPFQPITSGPHRVIALPANHDPESGSMLFAVTSDEGSIFYGTDTTTLFEETWQSFRQHQMRFDLVALDHSYGPDEQGEDHLSARQVAEHAERLREEGILKDGGRVFATHIAHEGNPVHPKLVAFASKHGYEVAYDGLEIVTRKIR
ncbi:MAG: MBL fold metallo-hydrolase [Anaerolineales bacterium]|jgi:phosphoribosyl 1,2-cyclic phosphate phosphodiesterase